MYQFFVEDDQIGEDMIRVTGSDVNHIKNVLRMKPGERVRISNQSGRDFLCSVESLSEDEVLLHIEKKDIPGTELPAKIYLFQGIPKGERMETVIEKAVELGVYEIIPVAMKYCVVKLDAKKAEKKVARWQEIARSAAKQSKRSIIPKIHPLMSFREAAEYAQKCDRCLVPYENEEGMAATAQAFQGLNDVSSISVFIGPEGGFAEEEIEALRGDSQVISLGKRILRTDTASITMLSMLMMSLEMSDRM
ncbi:MAG: 16S rRNA (uracil(1498)-N(3))-methyltransferase [bacterium]|nr:16S rRNA (uracil(1498)-N(3))-methyltransferase [bacterium]MDY4099360.1 16S rRNA (uracil(1498)-N(3))-methyltransferase [Lachnospiraceae bacterium]